MKHNLLNGSPILKLNIEQYPRLTQGPFDNATIIST